jgi:Mor family transcriptional regulator
VYKDMLTVLEFEDILILHQAYKGLQITFPKRLYSKEYVQEMVKKEYNGTNLKELSRRYNYSERWIRKMLKEEGED